MIKAGSDILDTDLIISSTAGEALNARDALYISTSDGKAYKCDADDLTKMDFIGFAQEAASSNGTVRIVHQGTLDGFSGLVIGTRYYISGTAGEITATVPTNITNIGVAITATTIRIDKFPTIRRVVFTSTGANTWTKRPGLKYIEVEVQGGGGNGGTTSSGGAGGSASGGDINITGATGGDGNGGTGNGALGASSLFSSQGADAVGTNSTQPVATGYGAGGSGAGGSNPGGGGGAGGYAKKLIPAGLLASTETATVGAAATTSTFTVTSGTNVVGSAGSTGGGGGAGAGLQGIIIVTEYY